MDTDLKKLEDSVAQLLARCVRLHARNQDLQRALDHALRESRQSQQRIVDAADRLEYLMENLPEQTL